MGNARPDEYNQPLLAADSWWNGLNAKVREMFVMAGTDETMFSDQEKFTRVLKVSSDDPPFSIEQWLRLAGSGRYPTWR